VTFKFVQGFTATGVSGCIGWSEANAESDMVGRLHMSFVQGETTTERGGAFCATQNVTAEVAVNASIPYGEDFTPTVTERSPLAGDRLVLELGYSVTAAETASRSHNMRAGGTGATDLTDGADASLYPGWIELTLSSGSVSSTVTAVSGSGITISGNAVTVSASPTNSTITSVQSSVTPTGLVTTVSMVTTSSILANGPPASTLSVDAVKTAGVSATVSSTISSVVGDTDPFGNEATVQTISSATVNAETSSSSTDGTTVTITTVSNAVLLCDAPRVYTLFPGYDSNADDIPDNCTLTETVGSGLSYDIFTPGRYTGYWSVTHTATVADLNDSIRLKAWNKISGDKVFVQQGDYIYADAYTRYASYSGVNLYFAYNIYNASGTSVQSGNFTSNPTGSWSTINSGWVEVTASDAYEASVTMWVGDVDNGDSVDKYASGVIHIIVRPRDGAELYGSNAATITTGGAGSTVSSITGSVAVDDDYTSGVSTTSSVTIAADKRSSTGTLGTRTSTVSSTINVTIDAKKALISAVLDYIRTANISTAINSSVTSIVGSIAPSGNTSNISSSRTSTVNSVPSSVSLGSKTSNISTVTTASTIGMVVDVVSGVGYTSTAVVESETAVAIAMELDSIVTTSYQSTAETVEPPYDFHATLDAVNLEIDLDWKHDSCSSFTLERRVNDGSWEEVV